MLMWITNNWLSILILVVLIATLILELKTFFEQPKEERIAEVKEWLLYAVTMAEKELGAQTGQLKLRLVYDMFVSKFTWLAKTVSFATFSEWVDESLAKMRNMIKDNEKVAEIVSK